VIRISIWAPSGKPLACVRSDDRSRADSVEKLQISGDVFCCGVSVRVSIRLRHAFRLIHERTERHAQRLGIPSCLALVAVCKGSKISDLPGELSFSTESGPKLPLMTVCYRVAWLSRADSAACCSKSRTPMRGHPFNPSKRLYR